MLESVNEDPVDNQKLFTEEDLLDGSYDAYLYNAICYMDMPAWTIEVKQVKVTDPAKIKLDVLKKYTSYAELFKRTLKGCPTCLPIFLPCALLINFVLLTNPSTK